MHNFMTTIAVVNQYGDLQAHKDFLYIIPPREPKPRQDGTEAPNRPGFDDDKKKHEDDKKAFLNIL